MTCFENEALKIEDLYFNYDFPILRGLSLSLLKNKIYCIIGTSGSGKTTLLRLIAQLHQPCKGIISFPSSKKPKQQIAYVSQVPHLLPWRTILQNLLLCPELNKQKQNMADAKSLAFKLLTDINLSSFAHHYPHQLSVGMLQRVTLAQSLMQKKSLLLLDEPFAGVDVIQREDLYRLLLNLKEKYHFTALMITHDFRDALALADKVFLLNQGKLTKTWNIPSKIRNNPAQQVELVQEMKVELHSSLSPGQGQMQEIK